MKYGDNKIMPSFGRRKARKLREKTQRTYDEILPLVQLTDPSLLFAGLPHDEIWLEIGFGGGEHMLEQLARNPSIAMIGCEPFKNGVANFLNELPPPDYARVRIWHEDVRYLFDAIPAAFFSRVFILFPDPWPKKRHRRRRLLSRAFVDVLGEKIKPGALLHVASDDVNYVEQIQEILYAHPLFKVCSGPPSADPKAWSSRPQDWPATRYEQKALTAGKKCAYMLFQRA